MRSKKRKKTPFKRIYTIHRNAYIDILRRIIRYDERMHVLL